MLTSKDDLIEVIKQQWKIILVLTLSGTVIGTSYKLLFGPKVYRSAATIMPRSKGSADVLSARLSGLLTGLGGGSNSTAEVLQMTEILKSLQLADRVQEAVAVKFPEVLKSTPRMNLQVSGSVFKLSVLANSPELSEVWARGYLDALQKFLNEVAVSQSQRSADFTKARVEEVKTQLEQMELKLSRLKMGDRSLLEGKNTSAQLEMAKLTREYQVQAKVLETLSQQYEVSQIEAKRDEVAFFVIDPPRLGSFQGIGLIRLVVMCAFLSFLLALGFSLLIRQPPKNKK